MCWNLFRHCVYIGDPVGRFAFTVFRSSFVARTEHTRLLKFIVFVALQLLNILRCYGAAR